MNIASKLRKSLDERWCMRFKTTNPDGDQYDGVIMVIHDDFVVLREERDFEFQGIVILPRKTINGYRDGKSEQCKNAVLNQNKQINHLKIPDWLTHCNTLPELFLALMQRDIWPCVEILFDEASQIYIGPVVEATEEVFHIRHYTAEGKWDKYYVIEYSWLLRVEFEDKYTKHFNAYMRNCASPLNS